MLRMRSSRATTAELPGASRAKAWKARLLCKRSGLHWPPGGLVSSDRLHRGGGETPVNLLEAVRNRPPAKLIDHTLPPCLPELFREVRIGQKHIYLLGKV